MSAALPAPLESLGDPRDWFGHIVIVHSDVKPEYFPTSDAAMSEMECIPRSKQVKEEIEKLGITCSVITADSQLSDKLSALKPDLAINFVDTIRGFGPPSAGIPTIFELLSIPYVGANTLCLSIDRNKYLTKTLLEAWEIPSPQYQLLRHPDQPLEYELRFPLILKLNEEHGGVGISENSVVTNEAELRKQLEFLIRTYHQHVLVEEYIENPTELTGLVLESQRVNVYLSERTYEQPKPGFKLLTFETTYAKELGQTDTIRHKQFIDKSGKIRDDIKKAFEILKMDDFGRFDIILDKYGNHFLVDSNANPAFGPDEAVANVSRANGHSFREVLIRVLHRNWLDQTKPKKFPKTAENGVSTLYPTSAPVV
jgi:D-alanine-D-alanine ligase